MSAKVIWKCDNCSTESIYTDHWLFLESSILPNEENHLCSLVCLKEHTEKLLEKARKRKYENH